MKRSVAVIVTGVVTTLTIMGGTLVAAQSGIFRPDQTTVQPHSHIGVTHNDVRNTDSLTDALEMTYYTETEVLDPFGPPDVVFTDTNQSDMPVARKLHATREKVQTTGSLSIARVRLSASSSVSEANHEVNDDNFTGITNTITGTQHEIDDDNFTGMTNTITGTHHHDIDDDNFTGMTNTITGTQHHDIDDDNFTGMTNTITGTHHREIEIDDDNHVMTGTMTDTHHPGDMSEHGRRIRVDDNHRTITGTVRGETRQSGNHTVVDVSRHDENKSNQNSQRDQKNQSGQRNQDSQRTQVSQNIQNVQRTQSNGNGNHRGDQDKSAHGGHDNGSARGNPKKP